MTYLGIKLHNDNDADIIKALEGKSKATEAKRLIRLGLEAERKKD